MVVGTDVFTNSGLGCVNVEGAVVGLFLRASGLYVPVVCSKLHRRGPSMFMVPCQLTHPIQSRNLIQTPCLPCLSAKEIPPRPATQVANRPSSGSCTNGIRPSP